MRNLKLSSQTGQSLLEIIVAIAIFAFIGSCMAPFIVGSFVGLERGGEQTQAEALAQEGIEAVRSIRNGAWNEIFFNQSAVIVNLGQWIFEGEGTTEQIGQFTRTITFDNVCRDASDEIITCPGDYTDIHSKKITVVVDWEPKIGVTNFVQRVAYLTNWDSQEWIQTNWEGGSGQNIWSNQTRYLTDDNIDISTTGEAKLKIGEGARSGFAIDNVFGAGLMGKNIDWTSLRFKAQNNKTVNTVRVYLEQKKGNTIYRYGLQSDNNGKPSGIWLGDNNQAYGDHQATNVGWQIIDLVETATITVDTTYHIVVYHQSGINNSANAIELRQSNPNNLIRSYDSSVDLSSNVLWSGDKGETWFVQEHQPIYVLDFLDGTHGGNPYHDSIEYDLYGTSYFGEQFTITGTDKVLSGISFLAKVKNQGPLDNLYVTIHDVTNPTVLLEYGIIATPNLPNNPDTLVTYTFSSPLTLTTGKTYRAYLSSPESDETQYYLIKSIYNIDTADLNSINYNGIKSHFIRSNDGGITWDTTSFNNHDINGFHFSEATYETSGELISSAFDMSAPSKAQTIEWDEIIPSCSPACEVRIQIQTAPDGGAWSTWCGPEGKDDDETDYFTNSDGELIHTDNNGDQWIKYKTILVGDSVNTPILEEIRINYKQ